MHEHILSQSLYSFASEKINAKVRAATNELVHTQNSRPLHWNRNEFRRILCCRALIRPTVRSLSARRGLIDVWHIFFSVLHHHYTDSISCFPCTLRSHAVSYRLTRFCGLHISLWHRCPFKMAPAAAAAHWPSASCRYYKYAPLILQPLRSSIIWHGAQIEKNEKKMGRKTENEISKQKHKARAQRTPTHSHIENLEFEKCSGRNSKYEDMHGAKINITHAGKRSVPVRRQKTVKRKTERATERKRASGQKMAIKFE